MIYVSIGSLGDSFNEAGVQNVTVTNSVFTKTQNGVRVKSWARPSAGYAKNLVFKNLVMRNVANPIIIDQKYCPDNSCPHQVCNKLLATIVSIHFQNQVFKNSSFAHNLIAVEIKIYPLSNSNYILRSFKMHFSHMI